MLTPFALDETLIRHLTRKKTTHSVTSGRSRYRDSWDDRYRKFHILNKDLKDLRAHGFASCAPSRWSCVVSNEGILNISLLFKNKQMPTINEAYGWMQQLIQETFPEAEALGGIRSF